MKKFVTKAIANCGNRQDLYLLTIEKKSARDVRLVTGIGELTSTSWVSYDMCTTCNFAVQAPVLGPGRVNIFYGRTLAGMHVGDFAQKENQPCTLRQ